MPKSEIVRRNSVGWSDHCCAFPVDLQLERKYPSQIKSTQTHPVRKSVACDLTERHQLTDMGSDPDASLVKEGRRNIIRSVFPVYRPRQGGRSTHRQSSSFQDVLDLSRTSEPVAIGRCQRQAVFSWEPRVLAGRANRTARRCAGTHPSTWAGSGRTGRRGTNREPIHEPFAPCG